MVAELVNTPALLHPCHQGQLLGKAHLHPFTRVSSVVLSRWGVDLLFHSSAASEGWGQTPGDSHTLGPILPLCSGRDRARSPKLILSVPAHPNPCYLGQLYNTAKQGKGHFLECCTQQGQGHLCLALQWPQVASQARAFCPAFGSNMTHRH